MVLYYKKNGKKTQNKMKKYTTKRLQKCPKKGIFDSKTYPKMGKTYPKIDKTPSKITTLRLFLTTFLVQKVKKIDF